MRQIIQIKLNNNVQMCQCILVLILLHVIASFDLTYLATH